MLTFLTEEAREIDRETDSIIAGDLIPRCKTDKRGRVVGNFNEAVAAASVNESQQAPLSA